MNRNKIYSKEFELNVKHQIKDCPDGWNSYGYHIEGCYFGGLMLKIPTNLLDMCSSFHGGTKK